MTVEPLGPAVNELGRDPAVVADCLKAVGIEAAIGERFESLLPNHEAHVAVVERAPSGAFVYRCDCNEGGAGDATLADMYASLAYHAFELRSKSERAIWHRLLLCRAGHLKPVPVHLPELPEEASHEAMLARSAFAKVLGLREYDHPGEPMMFSRRFVAALCQISEESARESIMTLVSTGVIRKLPNRWRNAYLYLPGDGRPSAGTPRR